MIISIIIKMVTKGDLANGRWLVDCGWWMMDYMIIVIIARVTWLMAGGWWMVDDASVHGAVEIGWWS